MSRPVLVSEVPEEEGAEGHSKVSSVTSSSLDCTAHNESGLKERNYFKFSDCSSLGSSTVPCVSEVKSNNLNLKATELRLGLPGSQSPNREADLYFPNSGTHDEKPLFPLLPTKDAICSKNIDSGNKRGYSDTIDRVGVSLSGTPRALVQGKFPSNSGLNVILSPRASAIQPSIKKEMPNKVSQEQPHTTNGTCHKRAGASPKSASAPAAKAQVVGWPPVRSFRKNSLVTTSKNNDGVDEKPGPGTLYVKVSMDGAPYLRKVDLRTYSTYQELSSALEKMFGWLNLDQGGSNGGPMEISSKGNLRDLLQGSEYVLTYEDKDGDWMLVGDVPWVMFTESCKRLKIMKGSDAIGLAPRAMEKSKSRT